MNVHITDEAEADFEHIGDVIAADNPTRAVSFVREKLSDMPGRSVSSLAMRTAASARLRIRAI